MAWTGFERSWHGRTAVALKTSSLCAFSYTSLFAVAKKHADGRIATFLLSLSNRFHRLGYSASEFKLSMSRSEIGNYLGLAFETVSRTLHKFQKQGLINIEQKYIQILDFPALKQVCTGTVVSSSSRIRKQFSVGCVHS